MFYNKIVRSKWVTGKVTQFIKNNRITVFPLVVPAPVALRIGTQESFATQSMFAKFQSQQNGSHL